MTAIRQTQASRPAPVRAMIRNEARLLMREPAMVIWMLIVPVAADIVLALLPATRTPLQAFGGLSVWQTYLPVLVIFTLSLMMVQLLPGIAAGYRENGILKRLHATPVSPAALLGADVVLYAGLGIAASAVLVVVPVILGNELPGNAWWFALAVVISLVSFIALGASVMALAPTARFATGIGTVATFILWFSAGLWLPRTVMPGWMATICDAVPGGAAVGLFTNAMRDQAPPWRALLVLAIWTLVSGTVAVRTFRWE
jgi:ABC-2 type transport system permease protein